MAKPRLTYFDIAASRGEECRLALHLAGIDFEDVRIGHAQWAALKPTLPYGAVPVLELPGHAPLAHSNAILVLIGRRHGLHPADDFEAARHEGMMLYVEEMRGAVGRTLSMKEAEKKSAREALASSYLPSWAQNVDNNLGDGPFFAGANLHVVDLKVYMVAQWVMGGTLDHIPATLFDPYPKLLRLHAAVRDHQGVQAWYARSR